MARMRNKHRDLLRWSWLLLLIAVSWPAIVTAHGSGTPRLADVLAGPYRLWVWSLPEPIRVGETHMSVAVTEREQRVVRQNPPTTNLDVQIVISSIDQPASQFTQQTNKQERLFQAYYETDFIMPAAGQWRATIMVTGSAGIGTAEFTFVVLPPQRVNWSLVLWGMLVMIAGIGTIWVKRCAD